MSRAIYGDPEVCLTLFPLLWALAACTPTVCDQTADWADRCGVSWTDADQELCRDHLRGCTGKEKKKLDAFWLCLDRRKFFECRDGDTGLTEGPPPTADDLLACRDELDGVHIECSAAIGLEGGTFAGLTTGSETP